VFPAAISGGVRGPAHGQLSLGKLDLAKLMAVRVAEGYARRTGRQKKLTGVQLGYESRCAPPHAFDVLLGCQLGLGAQRALSELALDGCMVSLAGQLQLHYVPFDTLVDPVTLMAQVRFVERGSDFHRLATQLGTQLK
jgi:6-phosphofructokinase 1